MLCQITAPHFVVGITVDKDDKVVGVAPIVKYMMNWPYQKVLDYCKKKDWILEVIS